MQQASDTPASGVLLEIGLHRMLLVRSAASSVVRCVSSQQKLLRCYHVLQWLLLVTMPRYARPRSEVCMLARWAESAPWSLQSSLFVAVAFLCLFNCVVLGFLLFLSSQNALPSSRGKADLTAGKS